MGFAIGGEIFGVTCRQGSLRLRSWSSRLSIDCILWPRGYKGRFVRRFAAGTFFCSDGESGREATSWTR